MNLDSFIFYISHQKKEEEKGRRKRKKKRRKKCTFYIYFIYITYKEIKYQNK